MKKRTILSLLFVILGLCLVFPKGAMAKMSAKEKAAKAKACYETFLRTDNAGGIPKYVFDTYDIVDINGDKVPELLYASYRTFKVYLFRYDAAKDKVVKVKGRIVGKAAPEIYYNKKRHMVYFVMADTAGSSAIMYKYVGKKLKKVYKLTYVNIMHGGPTYKYNGKKITEKSWNKKIDNVKKNYKTLRYKVYG